MKKIILLNLLSVFVISACSNDEYADLRKMTVADYLNDKVKMREVLDKCSNREIKDQDICETAKQAVNNNHKAW
jgi:hypothetical protein